MSDATRSYDDAPCPYCPKYFTGRHWDTHMEQEHADEPAVPFDLMATWYYSTDRKLSRLTKRRFVLLYLTGELPAAASHGGGGDGR